ncbi:MAG: helix-turn-helix domain-containing protein [Bacillaceae bacterium]|nr:helix-turn-helix domain-containing protein [Bacillaceae bacterium]
MSELGKLLKQTREEKKLTLDDIQRVTKIQRRYLEAIEKGNFSTLPGHFYVRAFIKSYAEAVGLSPDELFEEYKEELPEQQTVEKVTQTQRNPKPSAVSFRTGKWLSRILLYSFITLILFVIYMAFTSTDFLTSDGQDKSQDEENLPVIPDVSGSVGSGTDNQTDESDEPEPSPEPEPEPVLSFVKQEGNTYYYELENATVIDLSISAARGDCWTVVRNGQTELFNKTMKKGESQSWQQLQEQVTIVTGNGPAVDILVSGRNLDTSGLKQSRQELVIQLK